MRPSLQLERCTQPRATVLRIRGEPFAASGLELQLRTQAHRDGKLRRQNGKTLDQNGPVSDVASQRRTEISLGGPIAKTKCVARMFRGHRGSDTVPDHCSCTRTATCAARRAAPRAAEATI